MHTTFRLLSHLQVAAAVQRAGRFSACRRSRWCTHVAFDSALIVQPATLANAKPHLVLFENKFSRANAKNRFKTSELRTKVRLARTKLGKLFADTTREHPFRRAGIAGPDQVTLCFVVLRKDSMSDDTLQDELYELNCTPSIAFNVVLLDQAALKQHYGDTLAPSLAQCEHMLDENVRLPTS